MVVQHDACVSSRMIGCGWKVRVHTTATPSEFPSGSPPLAAPPFSGAFHDAPAAFWRPAFADVKLRILRVAGLLVLVVIRQLNAGLDVPARIDPDLPLLDDGLTVGIARVVDEPGVVP